MLIVAFGNGDKTGEEARQGFFARGSTSVESR